MMMIQVNMLNRQDQVVKIMLDLSRITLQVWLMMIINQYNSACDILVAFPLLRHKVFPDQVPDGLGTVWKFVVPGKFIQRFEKIIFQ